ncbi:MAG: META domain-containing protein [Alistipes sp.]|nr:META domain-containing protein [Alistipes sp.]
MKRTILFSLTLLIVALFTIGCCDCRKRSKLEKPLVGTTWQLVQIMAHDVTPDGDSYTLLFRSNGTATGKGDCNVFTATYRMTSSRELSISDIGSTRRLCPNQEAENAFFDLLETVTHYEMDADIMLLLSNGTLVGMMKALPAEQELDYLPL